MSKLNHPSLVRLYDVPPVVDVSSFDELYIVMELCDSDMGKLMNADVSLQPLHVTTLFYNLLVGLKYLHSAGVYHRDLKPANCLVNQDCSVKICDFGLSRAVGERHLPESSRSSRKLARRLTNHVATRWYRAPELILLHGDYTEAVDVWSVGCIYAELLGMLEGVKPQDRGPLFPGSSCFPLSPDQAHLTDYMFHTQENHDQLNMIFNVLGTPSAADIAYLDREDGKQYLGCFKAREALGIRHRVPQAEATSVEILEEILRFNPQHRVTVTQIINHKMFVDIRDSSQETEAPGPICLDFETGVSLDEFRLRSYFCKEIASFNSLRKTSLGGA